MTLTAPSTLNQPEKASDRWHVLLATWLGVFFDGMDASIYVLVLYPALSELLQSTSHSTVGVFGSYVLALFMVGWAVGAIVFGILSDYIGRVRTMILTVLLYAICTGLCATSHSWGELAFYRFLVGCGIGGEISAGTIMVSEYWAGKSRLYATSAMSSAFGFGYIAAALLNLWLGQFGWRWLFVAGIAPALLTLYIRSKLSEPTHFAALHEERLYLRKKPPNLLTAEEISLLRFTFPQIFNKENLHKTLIVVALASTAIVGYWAVLSWVPAWVNQLTGTVAVQERSITAIAMNVGGIFAAVLGGFWINWLGRARAFRLSFLGALICFITMFLTVKGFGPTLVSWAFVAGFFGAAPFSMLFIYVPELFNTHLRGTAFGFGVQLGRIFAAIAALVGGQLIAFFGGSYAMAGSSVASIYLVGLLASFFMPATTGEVLSRLERQRKSKEPAESLR